MFQKVALLRNQYQSIKRGQVYVEKIRTQLKQGSTLLPILGELCHSLQNESNGPGQTRTNAVKPSETTILETGGAERVANVNEQLDESFRMNEQLKRLIGVWDRLPQFTRDLIFSMIEETR